MKQAGKKLLRVMLALVSLMAMLTACTPLRTSEVLLTEGEGFSVELRDLSFADEAERILVGTLRFTFTEPCAVELTDDWRAELMRRHRPMIEWRNQQKELMIGYVEVQQTGDSVEYIDLVFSESVRATRNDVLRICFVTAPPLRFYLP